MKIKEMEQQMCMPLSTLIAAAVAKEINIVYASLSAPQRSKPVRKTDRREYCKHRSAIRVQIGLPAIFADRYHAAYAVLQHSLCTRLDAAANRVIEEFKLDNL